jgi:hypothetical protein
MEQATTGDPDRSWAEHAVGAADIASLHALATADPTQLTGAALVDAITASEKALSLLTGIQLRLLAAFSVPFVAGDPMRLAGRLARRNRMHTDPTTEQIQDLVADAAISLAGAEVAAALRISPVTAGLRVREAITMTTSLAPTLESLEHGVVDRGKARVIAEHCEPLTPEHTAAVQDMVLPAAGELTTSELRDFTGQAVITIDPNGAEERHQASAARRSLAIKSLPDAMATLSAFLPADGAVKIFQVSDLLATSTAASPGDNRGIAARRVDALVDIAEQLLTYGHLDLSEYLGQPLADSTTLHQRASHPAADEPDQQTDDREPDQQIDDLEPDQQTDDRELHAATPDVDENACPAEGVGADGGDLIHDMDGTSPPAGEADPEPTHSSTSHSDPADAKLAPFEPLPIRVRSGDPNPVDPVDHGAVDLAANEQPENAVGVADSFGPVGTESSARVGTSAAAPAAADPGESAARDGSVEPADVVDRPGDAGDDGRSLEATPTGAEVVVMPTSGSATPPGCLAEPDSATCSSSGIRGTGSSVDQTRLPARAGQRASRTFTRQGRRPHLSVTLGLGTLAGFDNLPGKLEGFGAIPAGLARSIAISAATITTQLVDGGTGIATHAGSLTYRPRQELRDQVAALNGTCRFPSCRQPVWRCDLDHREPFDHADPTVGGPTSPDNLDPYCRRHHLMKHHTDWRVRPDRESYALHFTSPTGHRYTKQQCPTAPYSVGMDNLGAAFAERLENMLATTKTESSKHSTGVIEELLTAALLRHHLTPRPIEYAPDKDFWANADDDPIGNTPGHDQASDAAAHPGHTTGLTTDLTVEPPSPADEDGNNSEADDELPPPF